MSKTLKKATKSNAPAGQKQPKSRTFNPVYSVLSIPLQKIVPNTYNPNSQQGKEINLLYTSILEDGYTQPVVCIYDEEKDMYVIVDGFHRYRVMKEFKDIYDANEGMLPVVVIDTDINNRMASTVRHNRARGKHSAVGMTNILSEMLKNGATQEQIMSSLGMTDEEYKRLVITNGVLKEYENVDYNNAWITKKQAMIKSKYAQSN